MKSAASTPHGTDGPDVMELVMAFDPDEFREVAAAITTLRRRWKRTGTEVIVEALRRAAA